MKGQYQQINNPASISTSDNSPMEILALKPIKLKNIRYLGTLGNDWSLMDYNLSKLIAQNILYAAYHQPRSVAEIAKSLLVNQNLIENEIAFLEENGFMDKVKNNKYLTNILIHDLTKEIYEERHQIYTKCAQILCQTYIPRLTQVAEELMLNIDLPQSIIYIPHNDRNFLMWALVSLACCRKIEIPNLKHNLVAHYVHRNDGSDYLVTTDLEVNFKLSYDAQKYASFGEMYLSNKTLPYSIWQYNTYYDERSLNWNRDFQTNFDYLYDYMKNEDMKYIHTVETHDCASLAPISKRQIVKIAPKNKEATKYDNLYQNGLIIDEKVNLIILKIPFNDFLTKLPDISEDTFKLNQEISEQIYNISKTQYPPHLQELAQVFYQRSITSNDMKIRILEQLLRSGFIKPINNNQKKTVNMIMFCAK